MGILTQRHHFVCQASQYPASSSFILMQWCVHKLWTFVIRNGWKLSEDIQCVETLGVQSKSLYAEKIAAVVESTSKDDQKGLYTRYEGLSECVIRRHQQLYFSWQNCLRRPTSLWKLIISLCTARWRIWTAFGKRDMSWLREKSIEINFTIWAWQLILNSPTMFYQYICPRFTYFIESRVPIIHNNRKNYVCGSLSVVNVMILPISIKFPNGILLL